MISIGKEMHDLCRELFPICRSLTGEGFRKSLGILKSYVPEIEVYNVPSGTKCFDWEIPNEWNINDAYILDPDGKKICDFSESNLHVVGYSVPVDRELDLEELEKHLYSLPDQPGAIPYITSYYKERWGFCLTHKQREKLKDGKYRVFIDSTLEPGHLTYGEILIPGSSKKEVFLSTYLCHPSMANNELSGPVVTVFLANWIKTLDRKYTYRIVIIPETIGSITYLSKNLDALKNNTVAGFNISCVGDDRTYSFLPSRKGGSLSDRAALHALRHIYPDFKMYSFQDRGSDERQYCSPGADLPVCSIMRSKFGCYPEYHTSLDDLNLVSPAGLEGGFNAIRQAIEAIEINETYKTTIIGEPQLGKRGLYPDISTKDTASIVKIMMNIIMYSDGDHDILQIADILDVPIWEMKDTINKLESEGVLKKT